MVCSGSLQKVGNIAGLNTYYFDLEHFYIIAQLMKLNPLLNAFRLALLDFGRRTIFSNAVSDA